MPVSVQFKAESHSFSTMPDFLLEKEYDAPVIGVDEAGRGPWAGPVVAGAVWLEAERVPADVLALLADSKKLTPARREKAFTALRACEGDGVRLATGRAEVDEIDRLNILKATYLAMTRAVAALGGHVNVALVDGNGSPDLPCRSRAVVQGDDRSYSIAAASIMAKVTRDREMGALEKEYPGYGWGRNMGYGTREHKDALLNLGVTPYHRRSFAPVRRMIEAPGTKTGGL